MPTNLAIDDRLLDKARKLGGHRTKRATVEDALSEYIERRQRQRLVQVFDTIDFDPRWNPRRQRGKR